MDTTSLEQLKKEVLIEYDENEMVLVAQPTWVIPGEDRLSYTTIVRLVECCREYHWQKDVLHNSMNASLDSIVKYVECNFDHPILIGEKIAISYQIVDVKVRSYKTRFQVTLVDLAKLSAEATLVSVFYDTKAHKALEIPSAIKSFLNAKLISKS